MRPLTLWRYEVRRAGWSALLTPPIAAVLGAVLAVATHTAGSEEATADILVGILELALPLAAGIGAASLIGADPAVELQLSVPTAYRSTLLRRLAVAAAVVSVVAVLAVGALVATGWWDRGPLDRGPLAGQLVWLAPAAGLGGLGFLAGAAFRNPAAAGGVVSTAWIAAAIFREPLQAQYWSRLLYPFATTQGSVPADWTANRVTLIGTSVALVGAGWLLLQRTERLVRGEQT